MAAPVVIADNWSCRTHLNDLGSNRTRAAKRLVAQRACGFRGSFRNRLRSDGTHWRSEPRVTPISMDCAGLTNATHFHANVTLFVFIGGHENKSYAERCWCRIGRRGVLRIAINALLKTVAWRRAHSIQNVKPNCSSRRPAGSSWRWAMNFQSG